MTPSDAPASRPVEALLRQVHALRFCTEMILVSFTQHAEDTKHTIIRNFIARGMITLETMARTCLSGSLPDCWILHRAHLDRLFHLHALEESGQYEDFERYTFVKRYEARNRILSDSAMRDKLPPEERRFSREHVERYKKLKAEGISWRRPKAEDVAREMELPFLYKYGYDFASTVVHPMADDGVGDFQRLTGGTPRTEREAGIVLSNSILAQVILTQEGLNASDLNWIALAYTFLEKVRDSLESGTEEYLEKLRQLVRLAGISGLCQRQDADDREA